MGQLAPRELETVEDFENLKAALDHPESFLHTYQVKAFGFCTFCNAVTEYASFGGIHGVMTICQKCNCSFGSYGHVQGHPASQYLAGDGVPMKVADEIHQLHSREKQRKFYNEALEKFITAKKSEVSKDKASVRQKAKEIHKLAALRV